MGKSVFITAISTNIGKTVVSSIICNILSKSNKRVAYYKPIQTGCYVKDNVLIAPDPEFVKSLNPKINSLATYLFEYPASPHLASKLANVEILIKNIRKDYENLKKSNNFIIIEGAGGIYVPLNENGLFMYHIPLKFKIPVILVSSASLGTINNVSLSYKFLKILNIEITAIILLYDNEPDYIEIDNQRILKKILNFESIYLLPKVKNCDTANNKIGNIFEIIEKYPCYELIEEWLR